MTRATQFFSFFSVLSGIYFALMMADLPEPVQLILPVVRLCSRATSHSLTGLL